MKNFSIGILTDSLKLPLNEALQTAKDLDVDGIQLYVAYNIDLVEEALKPEKRKEVKNLIDKYGVKVSAICGELGGHGFEIETDNERKVRLSKEIVDFALELNCNIISTHIGVVPTDTTSEKYMIMQKACKELAEYANSKGATFAIETGPETAKTLKTFLDSLGSKGMGANLDPANLVMVTDDDPVEAVYTLGNYIVHTHAKDGKLLQKTEPKVIYDFFAEGGIEDLRMEDYFLETPLGEGDVDFDNYIKALKDVGYNGFLTIEREGGPNPVEDVKMGVEFLKKYL